MIPRRRRLIRALALALSLLLVGMQLEGQVHALVHVGEAIAHALGYPVALPFDDEPCAECTLLAAGANAVGSAEQVVGITLAAQERSVPTPVWITPVFSLPYRSRAPPSLL